MNGFRMPRKEVELFLEDLHSLLSSEDFNIDQDLWISYRNKNSSTILALNYSRDDICKRLLEPYLIQMLLKNLNFYLCSVKKYNENKYTLS